MKFTLPNCRKMHFEHSFWLQKHSLHIVCLQQQRFSLELEIEYYEIEYFNSNQDWVFCYHFLVVEKYLEKWVFFLFFSCLTFWVIRGVINGSKWQNILSLTLHISGAIRHFLVHMCKMISPGMCSIFSKFLFLSKRKRNGPKILSFALHISGTLQHMIIHLWFYCAK